MAYRIDCVHYTATNNSRSRPYCHKLQREIRVRDCNNCGWYRKYKSNGMVDVDNNLNRLLRSKTREELGLDAVMDEDIKRLMGDKK